MLAVLSAERRQNEVNKEKKEKPFFRKPAFVIHTSKEVPVLPKIS